MEPLSDRRKCWASLWGHGVEEDLKQEAQTLISEYPWGRWNLNREGTQERVPPPPKAVSSSGRRAGSVRGHGSSWLTKIAQANPELLVLLPLLPEFWDYT